MTKKHFEKLAQIVRDLKTDSKTKQALAKSLAQWLETENPRFDSGRFVLACGPCGKFLKGG